MRRHFTGWGVISQAQDGASFHRMRRHFTGCGDFTGCGFISECGVISQDAAIISQDVATGCGVISQDAAPFDRMWRFHRIGKSHDEAISREDRQITAWGHTGCGVILQDGASFYMMRRHFTGCGFISKCGVISQDAATGCGVISQDAAPFHRIWRSHRIGKSQDHRMDGKSAKPFFDLELFLHILQLLSFSF